MFERLKECMKRKEHCLCHAALAAVYGAGCLGADKMAVQVAVTVVYAVMAMRG